jgi:putative spermidine/putrescine transport system permease protein
MGNKKGSITRFALFAITLLLMGVIVMPLAVAVMGAFINASWLGASTDRATTSHSFWVGPDAFYYLLHQYAHWMLLSLELALASVALCLLLGVPAGYALVRLPFPGSGIVEDIMLLPLSIPGIALSIALIAAYNSIRGQWLVLAGHLLYTLPFMMRVVTSTLRSYDLGALDAAAESLGAPFPMRMRRIVLPGLRHALMTGSLLVFSISWGEFNVSYLLNHGWTQTFPAALYDTYANESFQISSAATVLFLMVAIPVTLLLQTAGGEVGADVERSV